MSRNLRAGVISPHCCSVFGHSRSELSSGFSDVVALSATAPDTINDSRRFLPRQWAFWFHQLTPDGCLRPVCNSNPKWCEKAANSFRNVLDIWKRSPNFGVRTVRPFVHFAYAPVDKVARVAIGFEDPSLLALKNSGAITSTDRRMARPQDTALTRFYGLPKVHKDGAPLRPIVSLKGTPAYGLAKWLFRRLKFLTAESDTTVSSSAQFLEKLKGVSLHPNEVMVSFDVTSLFTSIPQDVAIETIELLLQSKYDETENRLGRAHVLQLLKFCLRTYFTFDGTIYEQVKGTPMGSPISGFIAEAVLQRLESLVFQHHKPKFWARYVDDTFVVIDRYQLLIFKELLNAVFPDIQFTIEEEENNQLTFLDVLVCRKDCGGLKTKVFRKATNTMQVLNFNSNHPISHKRSCVRTLYRRVETHCSEPEDKIAELQ
nr:unnamed protein product [Spirometra erinaceieuropaei]